MLNRLRQVPMQWKLLPGAIILILLVLMIYNFSRHRLVPKIVPAVDRPVKPRALRPVRKNAALSEQIKKINKKTDHDIGISGVKSFRCLVRETFNEATGVLRQEVDNNCDGIVDYCELQELNAYGEPVRKERYRNCGEEPSNCSEIERNKYGEVIAYNIDSDCNGLFDECQIYKRNDHGDIIETIIDKECDGKLEEGEEHGCNLYRYDEDGMIIADYAGSCKGKPELCASYEYDLSHGIRREKLDNGCDGTIDWCLVEVYREDSTESEVFIDVGCDGTWRSCSTHEDDGVTITKFEGHETCAKKYEEFVMGKPGK